MPFPLRWILPPLAFALAACAAPTPERLGPRPLAAQLRIDNPQRWPLTLLAVVHDQEVVCARPGAVATAQFALEPGAYVVRVAAPGGEMALPAPLFEPVLPPDRTLRLTVPEPAPAPDDPGFAFVPAGPALQGDVLGIGQEDERPARLVHVPAFWLGRREVTNAEYAAFLAAVAPAVDPAWCAFDSRKCRLAVAADGRHWTTSAPQQPVVTVSLLGARAYCEWRTRVTGVRHRLPHETEWEKAARGPGSATFAYGDVYRRNAANQESGALGDTGRHPPNGYGCWDLTGNAFEWTEDAYPASAADGPFQVLRGGSFVLDGMYLRNSFRMRQRPDVRTDDIGFRVLREAGPTTEATPR